MGRTVLFTVNELIWETRSISWTEEDYNKYVEWLSQYKDTSDEDTSYRKSRKQEYEVFKNYSWEDMVSFLNGEVEPDKIPVVSYKGGHYDYNAQVTEILKEALQEDAYAQDPTYGDVSDFYDTLNVVGDK